MKEFVRDHTHNNERGPRAEIMLRENQWDKGNALMQQAVEQIVAMPGQCASTKMQRQTSGDLPQHRKFVTPTAD